jgi:hypothetical protein
VLRDLRLLWSQTITVALVVASGIGGFLATLSAVDSLAQGRGDFYASARFRRRFREGQACPRRAGNGVPEKFNGVRAQALDPGQGRAAKHAQNIVELSR